MRSGNMGGRSFSDSVVAPGGDFANSADKLAQSFIAGYKTPQEVQHIAAQAALAKQALIDEQFKHSQEVARRNAVLAQNGIFDTSNADIYPTDQGGVKPSMQDVLTSPAGAKALSDSASQYVAAGGDIGQFQGLTRYNASVNANSLDTGVNDASIQRLGGSQPIGVDQALSPQGQADIYSRNLTGDVYKVNATKNMKDVVTNMLINDKLNGAPIPENLYDAAAIANPKTPEQASNIATAQAGLANLQTAKSLLVDPNTGKFDMVRLMEAGHNIPLTVGRQARNALEISLQAQRHLETGARFNEGEVQTLVDRFLPSVLDNPATKQQKIDNLQGVMSGTLHFIDPANPFLMKDSQSNSIIDFGGGPTKSTAQGTTSQNPASSAVVNPAAPGPLSGAEKAVQASGIDAKYGPAAAAVNPATVMPTKQPKIIHFNDLR